MEEGSIDDVDSQESTEEEHSPQTNRVGLKFHLIVHTV